MDKANLAALALVHGHARLIVIGRLEFRMLERRARSVDLDWILAEEPAHEVDIVDGHVDEDAARRRCEADGALHERFRIDARRLDHVRLANEAGLDLLHRISVRRVEAAHEAKEERELRMALYGDFRLLALLDIDPERLLREDVLASIERLRNLAAVQAARRDDGHGVDIGFREHLVKIRVDVLHTEFILRVLQLCWHDGAGCRELCIRDLVGNIIGMDFAETTETSDTDFNLFHDNLSS